MSKHLTKEQRYTISVMYQQDHSQTAIAKIIGKDKSVVSRELKRNCDKRSGEYNDDLAHRKYCKRLREKPKRKLLSADVIVYIKEKLEDKLSPEQIAGRAKIDGVQCVSHETIYCFIWNDKKKGGKLHENLRHRGRKYRHRGASKDKRGIIKNRIDIESRPKIVDEKTRFGDFEIDTVIGKNHKGALLTINERISGLVCIELLTGKNAEPVTEKTIAALMPIKNLLHTITADNGKEFAGREKIAQELAIEFYFAKPYHSWERGANENTNGLIRQYFPKGTSFENITNEQVKDVQEKLNNRPGKRLGFLTPNEYFYTNIDNSKVAFVA